MVVNDRGCSEPPKPGCVGAITRACSASRSSTGACGIEADAGMQEQQRPPLPLLDAFHADAVDRERSKRTLNCHHCAPTFAISIPSPCYIMGN